MTEIRRSRRPKADLRGALCWGWEASEPVLLPWVSATTMRTNKYAPVINTYLGQKSYEVKDGGAGAEDSVYFKASYSSESERLAADASIAKEVAQEGFVLLKNDGTLPMAEGRVTLLGVSAEDILYGGGGSGAVDSSTALTLKSALEASGFEVNPTMWSFYTEGAGSSIRMDVADIVGTGRYGYRQVSCALSDRWAARRPVRLLVQQ